MPSHISPGVYVSELDFSQYITTLGTTQFGVVGVANKGEVNKLISISNEAELIDTFGEPENDYFGLLCAIRYLRRGRSLRFVRVASSSVAYAENTHVKGNSPPEDVAKLSASSPGTWGNNIAVAIGPGTTLDDSYKVLVYYKGVLVETFDNLVLDDTKENYIFSYVTNNSKYVSLTKTAATVNSLASDIYTLSGGNSGTGVTADDIIGQQTGSTRTGLQIFRDVDNVDINILAVPGCSTIVPDSAKEIIAELIDIASSRGDCLALIDPPFGKGVDAIVDWHNGKGTGSGDPDAALNSSYAALFWPWVEVYDSYSGQKIWLPPSGHVAAVMAYTDTVRDVWFAPAGLQRGVLVDCLDTEYSPDVGERDLLYGGLNRVNPIVNLPVDGITIWGQKTLLRSNSALTSINVRRLLNYAKKIVQVSVRHLLFEPNDEGTWRQFVNTVEPYFRTIKARRGLYNFTVICDQTTNTPDRIARGEMWAKIILQPTRAAEIIEVEFAVTNTGTVFSEIEAL